jgi:hypothetical protein
LLRDLLRQPGWAVFDNAAKNFLNLAVSDLMRQGETRDVFRCQGRIDGIKTLMAGILDFVNESYEEENKE